MTRVGRGWGWRTDQGPHAGRIRRHLSLSSSAIRPLEDHDFVAGLRQRGLTAPFVVDGPMNGEVFRAYIEQVLAPTLTSGDIVIMDKLAAHKVAGIRQAIEARGASLLYLPPYSPDLNPIEQLFAKLEALLRKAAARSIEALWTAIGRPLSCFSPAECANYLANAGYNPISLKVL